MSLLADDSQGLNARFDPWSHEMTDLATRKAILGEIGYLIRRTRKARRMKLAELAEQCNVSQSVLCRIELGRRHPGLLMLMTICGKLGIRLSVLLRAAEDAAVPFSATAHV
jgi:ribosome-binding protein aMBF1 (putative translation factor)